MSVQERAHALFKDQLSSWPLLGANWEKLAEARVKTFDFDGFSIRVQCNPKRIVSSAASVHDERIGIGDVFHLFRLPEDIEQNLHSVIENITIVPFEKLVSNKEAALSFLIDYAGETCNESLGPINIGPLNSLRNISAWKKVAASYLAGFTNHTESASPASMI